MWKNTLIHNWAALFFAWTLVQSPVIILDLKNVKFFYPFNTSLKQQQPKRKPENCPKKTREGFFTN